MENELYHHGIKGMKWGIRRHKNKDGTSNKKGQKSKAEKKVMNKSSGSDSGVKARRKTERKRNVYSGLNNESSTLLQHIQYLTNQGHESFNRMLADPVIMSANNQSITNFNNWALSETMNASISASLGIPATYVMF